MQITFDRASEGLGPSEKILEITTKDGSEEVVVSSRVISGNSAKIGVPVTRRAGYLLIELFQETASGKWRIWVPESKILAPV